MRNSIVAVLAALSAATVAVPAAAEGPAFDEAPVAVVTYRDLDIASPEGAAALDARIGRAIDKVCERPSLRDLKAGREWKACHAEARDAAMEQLSLSNPFEAVELASNF